jgi:hypothetical protein
LTELRLELCFKLLLSRKRAKSWQREILHSTLQQLRNAFEFMRCSFLGFIQSPEIGLFTVVGYPMLIVPLTSSIWCPSSTASRDLSLTRRIPRGSSRKLIFSIRIAFVIIHLLFETQSWRPKRPNVIWCGRGCCTFLTTTLRMASLMRDMCGMEEAQKEGASGPDFRGNHKVTPCCPLSG